MKNHSRTLLVSCLCRLMKHFSLDDRHDCRIRPAPANCELKASAAGGADPEGAQPDLGCLASVRFSITALDGANDEVPNISGALREGEEKSCQRLPANPLAIPSNFSRRSLK